MIHPIFDFMPDKNVAEICSEIFDVPKFTFATNERSCQRYEGDGYPPTPAYLGAMAITYLEETEPGLFNARSQFTSVDSTSISLPEVADMYEDYVGRLQSETGILNVIYFGENEASKNDIDLTTWYVNKVAQKGGKLLSAYVISRAEVDGQLIDAVAIPRGVADDLPLMARDTVATLRPELEKMANSEKTDDQVKGHIREILKIFLINDPILKNISTIASASLLPDAKQLSDTLRLADLPKSPSQPPKSGGNRASRRANKKGRRF